MFVNNWCIEPGLMKERPERVLDIMNAQKPQAMAQITIDTIGVIMTADDHEEGKTPFQWIEATGGWADIVRARAQERSLFLHLESFRGTEGETRLPSALDAVPSHAIIGWEPDAFRHLSRGAAIVRNAQQRNPTSYTHAERWRLVSELHQLASAGILRNEFCDVNEAALRADHGSVATHQPFVYQAFEPRSKFLSAIFNTGIMPVINTAYDAVVRPRSFNAAVDDWFDIAGPKRQDIRTLPDVHQRMAWNIQCIINENPQCLHLVSAGNAHLKPGTRSHLQTRPMLQQFIAPPSGTVGIVDAETT